MKKKLQDLIIQLRADAEANIKQSKEGSPVTSMADDSAAGQIGKEQMNIARKLELILRDDT